MQTLTPQDRVHARFTLPTLCSLMRRMLRKHEADLTLKLPLTGKSKERTAH